MGSLTIVWIALALGVVGLGASLYLPRRRPRQITCPADEKPREVVFVGRPLHLDRWDEVLVCGRPGEEPRHGADIHCAKKCRESVGNTPRAEVVYWRGAPD